MKSLNHTQRLLMSIMSPRMSCMSSTITLLLMRTCLNQRAATYRLVSATRSSLRRTWVEGRNIESTDADLTVLISCLMSDKNDENDEWSLVRCFMSRISEKQAPRQQVARTRRNRSSSSYEFRSPRSNSRTPALTSCTAIRNRSMQSYNCEFL